MRYWRRIARASAKVVGSGTVGPEPITAGSSPGTSEIRRLTTRAGCAAAAAALDCRQVLPDRVHLGDVGARGEQRAVDRLLVLERKAFRRQREQCRRAARDQAQHQVVRARALRVLQDPSGGGAAGSVRHRMRRLDHLDPGARHGVAVAGHHEAFERPGHVPLDRARHRRRGLAGAEHDGAAGGRRRQMRRQHRGRLRRFDRGVQQPAQEGSRLDRHPGPVATAASTDRRCAVSRSPRHCLPA